MRRNARKQLDFFYLFMKDGYINGTESVILFTNFLIPFFDFSSTFLWFSFTFLDFLLTFFDFHITLFDFLISFRDFLIHLRVFLKFFLYSSISQSMSFSGHLSVLISCNKFKFGEKEIEHRLSGIRSGFVPRYKVLQNQNIDPKTKVVFFHITTSDQEFLMNGVKSVQNI